MFDGGCKSGVLAGKRAPAGAGSAPGRWASSGVDSIRPGAAGAFFLKVVISIHLFRAPKMFDTIRQLHTESLYVCSKEESKNVCSTQTYTMKREAEV